MVFTTLASFKASFYEQQVEIISASIEWALTERYNLRFHVDKETEMGNLSR